MRLLGSVVWFWIKLHLFFFALVLMLLVLGACSAPEPLHSVQGFEFNIVRLAFESGVR